MPPRHQKTLAYPIKFLKTRRVFIREKSRKTGRTAIQIVETKRVDDKIVQRVVRHVGQGENSREIEKRKMTVFLQEEYGVDIPLQKIYRMMDRLGDTTCCVEVRMSLVFN